MQKKVEITVPAARTDELLSELRGLAGRLNLQVARGASVDPPGDVLTAVVSNRTLHELMRELQRRKIGGDHRSSITTSELTSVIAPPVSEGMGSETSILTWEEIELEIGKESNMTLAGMAVMAISGALAVVGLATNAVHLVIGAAAIAPGFVPIIRIPLGLLGGSAAWKRGLAHTTIGYGILIGAAALAAWIMQLLGIPLPGGQSSYLPSGALVSFWSTFSTPGLIASLIAGAAGALLVASGRAVLTAGVMIALALVPAAAVAGLALAAGDTELFRLGLLRWTTEVILVLLASTPVFVWKRFAVLRRKAML